MLVSPNQEYTNKARPDFPGLGSLPKNLSDAYRQGDAQELERRLAPIASQKLISGYNISCANGVAACSVGMRGPSPDIPLQYLNIALRHGADPSLLIDGKTGPHALLSMAIHQDADAIMAHFEEIKKENLPYVIPPGPNQGGISNSERRTRWREVREIRLNEALQASYRNEIGWKGALVSRLLAAGANPNPVECLANPLTIAAVRDHLWAVRVLLEYGAKAQIHQADILHPLGAAAARGNREMFDLLIERDPSFAKVRCGASALKIAIAGHQFDFVDKLLALGECLNGEEGPDWHAAIHPNQAEKGLEMLHHLFDRGADIHAKDSDGRSSLHIWARMVDGLPFLEAKIDGVIAKFDFLIGKGARVDDVDNGGTRAFDMMKAIENREFQKAFSSRHADWEAKCLAQTTRPCASDKQTPKRL